MNPHQPQTDELEQRISATLERSTDALDGDTRERLQRIRADALQQPRRNYRPAMMIAASLLIMILVPWLSLRQPSPASETDLLGDAGYLSEDPDMLADWDMLDAIGEVPDA